MFRVKLFGTFKLTLDDNVLDEDLLKSHMLTKLLVYLLIHHDRTVTNQELEQYLWEDGSVQGRNALKNLVCRLRNILEKAFDTKDFILSGRGYYKCNPDYQFEIDCEYFEKRYDELKDNLYLDADKRVHELEVVIDIYDGMYMSNNSDNLADSNLVHNYHAMFLHLTELLLGMYWTADKYEAIEYLCNKVLQIDPLDERANVHKTRVLVRQNKIGLAQRLYHTLEKRIKNGSGIQYRNLLSLVRNELVNSMNTGSINLQQIYADISSKENETMESGTYFCSYEEFKSICGLQRRNDKRSKSESYILLITINVRKEHSVSAEVSDFLIGNSIEGVKTILKTALRECDVVTQCSNSQFVVLLYDSNYQGTLVVANRLKRMIESASNGFTDADISIDRLNKQ